MWLVILSMLLAGKRTLEFYAEQLITGNKKGRPRKGFKDVFLKVCQKRDNIIGDTVMVHLQETPSDIHAADTRY